MRVIATIIAAILLLAGCGSSKPAGSAASPAPSTVTVTVTTTPSAQTAPTTPTTVELAELNYQETLCSASLQIYVAVDQKSYKPPTYSRAVRLGLDGCTKLTKAQYEQAVMKWVNLGD